MKVQLEVFLTSVHLRLLTHTINTPTHPSATSGKNNLSKKSTATSLKSTKTSKIDNNFAKEELALESLLEFCREPSLMQDLYTNYDCDVQCTNLFDSIITVLCARAVPNGLPIVSCGMGSSSSGSGGSSSSGDGRDKGRYEDHFDNLDISYQSNLGSVDSIRSGMNLNILHKLALDGVFAVLNSIAVKCSHLNHNQHNNNNNHSNSHNDHYHCNHNNNGNSSSGNNNSSSQISHNLSHSGQHHHHTTASATMMHAGGGYPGVTPLAPPSPISTPRGGGRVAAPSVASPLSPSPILHHSNDGGIGMGMGTESNHRHNHPASPPLRTGSGGGPVEPPPSASSVVDVLVDQWCSEDVDDDMVAVDHRHNHNHHNNNNQINSVNNEHNHHNSLSRDDNDHSHPSVPADTIGFGLSQQPLTVATLTAHSLNHNNDHHHNDHNNDHHNYNAYHHDHNHSFSLLGATAPLPALRRITSSGASHLSFNHH